ncbi:MAG: ABC transporter permease [Steroidobacteraceae bacterium]
MRNSALRQALRRPGFMLGNSLILGLALGANVAAFAILYGYLFRPLPYAARGELLVPREQALKIHLMGPQVSVPFFESVRQVPQFHDAALFNFDDATVEVNGTSTMKGFAPVTPSIFALFGVKPLLGRTLSPASGRPGGPREAVLSYAYWTSAFGASPRVLGKTLRVDGQTLQIVGVMPPRFALPGPGAAFWIPFVITPALARDDNINPFMLIRRPAGWTLARVDAMLRSIHDRSESPAERAHAREVGFVVDAMPYRSMLLGFVGGTAPFWGLWGATLALLLVAALNALNLALARQRERMGELHLREVLGATAVRLVRLLFTEYAPILLGTLVVAAALAGWIVRELQEKGLSSSYLPFRVELSSTVLAYLAALAVTILGGVVTAAIAAVFLGRRKGIALEELGTQSSAGRAFKRTQAVFAAVQIGIALVLAICAMLFTRSLFGLLEQPLHYDGRHVTVAQVELAGTVSPAEFWSRARPVFDTLPGARSAALSSMIPFGDASIGGEFKPIASRHPSTWTWMIGVSPRFFTTLGIHPLAGRLIQPTDETAGASVVVISEALAREFFDDENPVGKMLHNNLRIVGVVPTVPWKLDPQDDHHGYAVYLPLTFSFFASKMHFVCISVESNAAPAVLFPAIRHALANVQPDAAISSLSTLPQMLQQASVTRAAFTWLVAGFAGLAFLIAVFGVYAVVAYGTRMRLFEMAIREVLGATRAAIVGMMVREVAVLFATGGVVGVILAFICARALRAELYSVGALDPVAYVGSVAVVGAAVLIAALLPALRATRSNPAKIMRR